MCTLDTLSNISTVGAKALLDLNAIKPFAPCRGKTQASVLWEKFEQGIFRPQRNKIYNEAMHCKGPVSEEDFVCGPCPSAHANPTLQRVHPQYPAHALPTLCTCIPHCSAHPRPAPAHLIRPSNHGASKRLQHLHPPLLCPQACTCPPNMIQLPWC